MKASHTPLFVTAICALASPALAGPEWEEPPDACSMIECAQTPIGTGPMAGLKGELSGASAAREDGDFEDVFRIYIDDPKAFSAFVSPNSDGRPTFDSQMRLFNRMGYGLLGNDDNPSAGMNGESGFENMTTDGSNITISDRGVYFLAISGAGNFPRNNGGVRIFNLGAPGEVSGPDGVLGASARLESWIGMGETGAYTIQLTGVIFLPPEERADINADTCIDSEDLALLLAAWGQPGRADLNSDGITDSTDLAILLAAWGCLANAGGF